MKILVTGGAGFLGSNLCERLLRDGHKVICVDKLWTGSAKNIEHLMQSPHFQFLAHDVTQPLDIHVDQIYNLASPASPRHYQSDPIQTMRTNIFGILNILEIAKQSHARLLQASTSEIYGDPLQHPQKETYWGNVNPIGPRACYDESKRIVETFCMEYHRQYAMNICIIRIFNTYGPRMAVNDGRIIPNFIVQALRGEPIVVHGEGLQTRSFCYVDDLIDGIVRMMNSTLVGPVNFGNPGEFLIIDVAELIIRLTNSKSKIINKELPQDDPRQRCPDITLAKKELHWEPTVTLEEGLKKTIEYFRRVLL